MGQHFLKDKDVINRIVIALEKTSFTNLLEVGPGGGALTEKLLQIPTIDLKAVEIDKEKVDYLSKKFPQLQIIHADFLSMQKPFEKFSLIGNYPYNISSQILFKIIDWFPDVETMIGMFQKEVAERVVAKPGGKDYGILSVLVQYYFEAKYLFTVGKDCFNPPPKIESAVIQLNARKELITVSSERDFKKIVKASFAQRRKTLRNNLKGMMDAEKLTDSFFDRRAETLSLDEFAKLTFQLNNK